jgi:hypothetical protein
LNLFSDPSVPVFVPGRFRKQLATGKVIAAVLTIFPLILREQLMK